jgi:putative SOS response-associated peptidase YedK
MCYSARVRQNLSQLSKRYGARVAWQMYEEIFRRRAAGEDVRVARGLERNFAHPSTETELRTKEYIDQYVSNRRAEWESEIFTQRRRLGGAEESLKVKETKKAREDVRIATKKIQTLLDRLTDLRRTEPIEDDERIFPLSYAPVLVQKEGETIIFPMRYACRLGDKPANYDSRFPGTYNARRDNLTGFWKNVYGRRHAVMVISGFFENVPRHLYEHRDLLPDEKPENLILQFAPHPSEDMLVACIWDQWKGPDQPDLLSFAAVTDEPPAEIAATGHQRCVIVIEEKNLSTWLSPAKATPAELDAILDDRAKRIFEHKIAA